MAQSTQNILMVRPASFGYNPQTAGSNPFQHVLITDPEDIKEIAIREFDNMVSILEGHGVNIHVFQDTPDVPRTDAVFPNNWISTHRDGHVVLYSMFSPNRREERRMEVVHELENKFEVNKITDLSMHEHESEFLEGTGSMVLDRVNRKAYACYSPRTSSALFRKTCELLNYEPILFTAEDKNGIDIYHTNVLMTITSNSVIICLEAIKDLSEKETVVKSLEGTGHHIINISLDQLASFAGNMLELKGREDKPILAMSASAFDSLTEEQKEHIRKHNEIVAIPVNTIESTAGGSVRCMIAEIFLPTIL